MYKITKLFAQVFCRYLDSTSIKGKTSEHFIVTIFKLTEGKSHCNVYCVQSDQCKRQSRMAEKLSRVDNNHPRGKQCEKAAA